MRCYNIAGVEILRFTQDTRGQVAASSLDHCTAGFKLGDGRE